MAEDMNMTTAVQYLFGYDAPQRHKAIDFLASTYTNPMSRDALHRYVFDNFEQEQAQKARKQKFTPKYDSEAAVYILNKTRGDITFLRDVYEMHEDPMLVETAAKMLVNTSEHSKVVTSENLSSYLKKIKEDPYIPAFLIIRDLKQNSPKNYSGEELLDFVEKASEASDYFSTLLLRELSKHTDVEVRPGAGQVLITERWSERSNSMLASGVFQTLIEKRTNPNDVPYVLNFIDTHEYANPAMINNLFKNKESMRKKLKGNQANQVYDQVFETLAFKAGYAQVADFQFGYMNQIEGNKFLEGLFMGAEREGEQSISDTQAKRLRNTSVDVYKATKNFEKAFEVIKDDPSPFVADIVQMSFSGDNLQLQDAAIKQLLPLIIKDIEISDLMNWFDTSPDPVKMLVLKSVGNKMDMMGLQRIMITESDSISWQAKSILESKGLRTPRPEVLREMRKKHKFKEPEEI